MPEDESHEFGSHEIESETGRIDGGIKYQPFEGAVLTDTFQMTEENDQLDLGDFIENSERVLRQNELPITVIVGNPPYSVGQSSANDNNQNDKYPTLDEKIAATYAARTEATNKNSLYDSYIRSFRWASDRIGKQGVVCFVSNAGWLRGQAMNGMRRCLAEEFDDIYVFDLRGNARTSGEERRKEKDNVFGMGTRTPVAITLLVKHAGEEHAGQPRAGRIHYHDIGDYLSRDEKLDIVRNAAASGDVEWQDIEPDKYGDWLNQRDDSFYEFAPMGLENRALKKPNGLFCIFSSGVQTNRDAWTWNFSVENVSDNVNRLINNTNSEIERVIREGGEAKNDSRLYSWTRKLRKRLTTGTKLELSNFELRRGLYRPFSQQFVFFNEELNEYQFQMPKLFPSEESNTAICLSSEKGITALVSKSVVDTHFVGTAQCFPLYWYEEAEIGSADGVGDSSAGTDPDGGSQGSLFDSAADSKTRTGSTDVYKDGYIRHDAITDETLAVFRAAYPQVFQGRRQKDGGSELTKEDIFYYVYGILHSPEYRKRFAANLAKELPRIPLAQDFAAFSRAGRKLADLHLGYEEVEPWAEITEDGDNANPGRTEKMRFGKCKKTEENPKGVDRTVLHVAERMTLRNIPEAAYSYVVNGRSAIEWLIDRYQVRTDKASGIVNDPNDYSDDPRYIVDLVKRVVTVSMRTREIVGSLPPLNEKAQPENWPFTWRTPTSS